MGQPKSCVLALTAAVALATSVGCHSSSVSRGGATDAGRTAWGDRPSMSPGIALPSPNAVLLASSSEQADGGVGGAIEMEASRNDHRMGAPTAGGFVVQSVEREWYQRDRIQAGRSYRDARFTTRIRERSMPWRP